MALKDILKFQLKRVNPFQGLVIDADTWRDAHEYHREQQKLHTLAFHSFGIVEGLEVTASNPPDLSVTIQPGMAVDPEGSIIIVRQSQQYRLQSSREGIVHLIIEFREIPGEPLQPPEVGQPTRILEAYRIEEREKLPDEPHLELARIDFDPAEKTIKEAKNPSSIKKNEIDHRFRRLVSQPPTEKPVEKPRVVREEIITTPQETIALGHMALEAASKELHTAGLKNLVSELNWQNNFTVNLEENIALDESIGRFTLIYVTGNSRFELNTEQQASLNIFLQAGGVIFGEGCVEGESEAKGAKEFGLAFNQLASQLNCKLEVVGRGHSLLSAVHVFSEVPRGAEPVGMLLEGGHMVYGGSDYGCAWQGGHRDDPLPRDIIRNSFEMGINIIAYARAMKAAKR